MPFPKVIIWQGFEPAYYNVTVQYDGHNITGTLPYRVWDVKQKDKDTIQSVRKFKEKLAKT